MYRWEVRPLGPSSLLWQYAGDRRLSFVGLSAGLLQLMHPAIGAGVVQHSAFFTEPWERIERSVPEIIGVIYDADPERTGRRVRDVHTHIQGVDHLGRQYRALDPETFWWAHATFQWGVQMLIERFTRRRLDAPTRESLYLDGVEWYRRYGVSMRPVPRDHEQFVAKWQRICTETLEMTPAADRAVDMALHFSGRLPPSFPAWVTTFGRPLVVPALRLCTLGALPGVVRERFGIPWSIEDEVQYRALQVWVREAWRFVPGSVRRSPRALAAENLSAVAEAG